MLEENIDKRGAVMCGQIAPLVKNIRSAAKIIDSTLTECKEILDEIQSFPF